MKLKEVFGVGPVILALLLAGYASSKSDSASSTVKDFLTEDAMT